MFHLILLQTSYDIFFIDWEKPQIDTALMDTNNSRSVLPPIKSQKQDNKNNAIEMDDLMKDQLRRQNKISCWRTLFVANEWNELQTLRKTSTTVQLIFVLFLLKVINLEDLALRDCSEDLFKPVNEYKAPYSAILRVAIASSMLIAICKKRFYFYLISYPVILY